MVTGIVKLCAHDEDRLARGRMLFDDLYAAFSDATLREAVE